MKNETLSGLRKSITLRHAVALYVSSVLGSGVLVLPGLAATIAGPASLVAWALLTLASYPFAYTFASLSARRPESGGVYSFAKEAFGPRVAGVAGWLFILWHAVGGPAVCLIAASYLAYAFPLSTEGVYLVAAAILVLPYATNLRGIVFSGRVQVAAVASIVVLLVTAIAVSLGSVRVESFAPFMPRGLVSIGTAAALIFWSFLGYENVSNVAEEFKDPKRDFFRSVLLSVVIVGLLYFSVAFVTVGTGAYAAGGSVAPFAALFSRIFGAYGAAGTAVLAVGIVFGALNAYTAGMSRVALAVARDGMLPSVFARVNGKTGAPSASLHLITALALGSLALLYFLRIDLTTALLIPSGAAIIVYVIGSAAGIKLLPGRGAKRLLPWLSFATSLAVLPFIGGLAFVAVAVALASIAYGLFARASRPTAEARERPKVGAIETELGSCASGC